MYMDKKKIEEMYLRIKYKLKILNSIEKDKLQQIESDVYNNLSDEERIAFELNNLRLDKNSKDDIEAIFNKIVENIKALLEDEKKNGVDHTSEIKKQITLAQLLLNKQIGFYEILGEIDKDYIENSLSFRR